MWVIAKVAERCNLDCPYCYMYHAADSTWRSRPAFLSQELQPRLIRSVAEYALAHPNADLTLALHGGEPLLIGLERMRELLQQTRSALPASVLDINIQSNGTMLTQQWLDLFAENDVGLGLSCDGPADIQNAYRPFRNGGKSADAVEAALVLAANWERVDLFTGVLAVANPTASGAEVLRYFFDLGIKKIDILIPDGNYLHPPAGLPDFGHDALLLYLKQAFDEWISIGSPKFTVRTFRIFVQGIMGIKPSLDCFGADISKIAVVESDGSLQLDDVLRICGPDSVYTGLNIVDHDLEKFIEYARGVLPNRAPRQCSDCRAVATCGGGYLPHRYDGTDFDRPSYHCSTLLGLYDHIFRYVRSVTPASMWTEIPARAER